METEELYLIVWKTTRNPVRTSGEVFFDLKSAQAWVNASKRRQQHYEIITFVQEGRE